jgi:large subunit ribosomal protein L29
MLKITEIRGMSDQDLADRLDSSKQELMKLRERFATRQLEDTSQVRQVKRDIARLLTIQQERLLGLAKEKNV